MYLEFVIQGTKHWMNYLLVEPILMVKTFRYLKLRVRKKQIGKRLQKSNALQLRRRNISSATDTSSEISIFIICRILSESPKTCQYSQRVGFEVLGSFLYLQKTYDMTVQHLHMFTV